MVKSKCLILIILALLLSLSGAVQGKDNSLKAGSRSLQFQIGEDFTLHSFQGATLSFKYHTSDDGAWRLGISTYLDSDHSESTNRYDSEVSSNSESDYDDRTIDLRIQRVNYTEPTADLNFFFGFGPSLGLLHSKSERKTTYPDQGEVYRIESVTSGWHIGVEGVIGVEWFAGKSISFLAEYSTGLFYSSSKLETEEFEPYSGARTRYSETESSSFSFSSASVKFGLSAYFD